jgi:hypothetical protein
MKKLLLFLVIGFVVFSACKKDNDPAIVPNPTQMEDLKINKNFDWKTSKDYQFTFTGKVNKVVRIVSSDGTIYHKAFLKANIPYIIKLSLPSYQSMIYLMYNGQSTECVLDKTNIVYDFK